MMPKKIDDKVVPLKAGIDPGFAALLDIRDTMGLRLNDKRKPIGCLENVVTILLKAPEWQDVLALKLPELVQKLVLDNRPQPDPLPQVSL